MLMVLVRPCVLASPKNCFGLAECGWLDVRGDRRLAVSMTRQDGHVELAVRAAAAVTASLSPELLTPLTQALRRPPPPDPLQPLSPREREVLQLIARGHSNRQIARDMAIGEQTVKTHVRNILTKLGLQDPPPGSDLRHPPSSWHLRVPAITLRVPGSA